MVVFHNDIINAIAQARNIRHLLASDILERWQQGQEATQEQTQSLIQLGDWIDFLTDSEQLIVDDCIDSTDVWNIIQKIGEQAIGLDCVGTNYNYNNPPPTPTPNVFNYVESVTGLNTNNADPQNPVVRISVDGTTITGDGTPASPLVVIGGGGGGVSSVSATAGTGISVTVTNPTTTPNINIVNTAPDQTVVINDGDGIDVTGSYPNFTVNNTDKGSSQNIFKNIAVAGEGTIVADSNNDTLTVDAGTGIQLTTNTTSDILRITNSAPDQTVVLNAGTGIGVTGTYPNFTISSSGGGITKATAAGTDTYTTTITGVTGYADGDTYLIRFTNGNTTAATLNINTLGAKSLFRNNDGALIGGDIWNGGEMLCIFNSTLNGFQCIGTSPNSLFAYVTNADSVSITKGQAVYVFGGTGDRITVKLASNQSDLTSAQTIGIVVTSSIAANQKGIIIVQGQLDGLSLFPTSTWADGDFVYLGATAGTVTKTKPYAPDHLVYLGYVVKASAGSAGRMYVKVQNGYELDELHNVSAQTPVNKDGLFYNSTTGLWTARQVAATDIDANVSNTEFGYLDGVTSSIQTQLNGKEATITAGTTSQYYRGDKTFQTLDKSAVGLSNVDNTSDATKNSATATLTNKRINPRTGTVASSATPTINTDNVDFYSITALTVDITNMSTNLSGTPVDGQTLWIAITGTAARAITWGTSFESSGNVTLPTTTVTTTRLDVAFIWNTATSKWRCVGVA
jgi:hypothetical protein